MKRKAFIFIMATLCALVFVFAGCTDPEGQDPGQSDQTAPPPTQVEQGSVLVAYFSCTGNTEGIAEIIAEVMGGTLFEIVPEVPYTDADLNYNNSDSRANREQNDENARPAIANEAEDMASYDTVFLGYPIWWGDAPRIVQTFLESYDFEGKEVYTFSTSGSSSGSGAFNGLSRECPDIDLVENLHFTSSQLSSAQTRVQNWIDELGIMNNEQTNRISFTVGDETVYATLRDNSAARDLVSRLIFRTARKSGTCPTRRQAAPLRRAISRYIRRGAILRSSIGTFVCQTGLCLWAPLTTARSSCLPPKMGVLKWRSGLLDRSKKEKRRSPCRRAAFGF